MIFEEIEKLAVELVKLKPDCDHCHHRCMMSCCSSCWASFKETYRKNYSKISNVIGEDKFYLVLNYVIKRNKLTSEIFDIGCKIDEMTKEIKSIVEDTMPSESNLDKYSIQPISDSVSEVDDKPNTLNDTIEKVSKYKIITLCGSTRFKNEFMQVQKELTLKGNIVISVGLFSHSDDDEVWKDGTEEMLDDMHKRKIDMADEIFIINKDGYIGSSTKSEIEYAMSLGKPVNYMEDTYSK